ncbi:MAG: hypothetical protein LBQ62_04070 [Candidatus Accumulibacter sp.]|jgi:hypothetical protein|nr:hypothetical protein [Accumulibacter sp.]
MFCTNDVQCGEIAAWVRKEASMFACQFEAVIENGAIRVPDEYLKAGVRKFRVLPDAPRAAGKPRFFPDLKLSTGETRFDRKEAYAR